MEALLGFLKKWKGQLVGQGRVECYDISVVGPRGLIASPVSQGAGRKGGRVRQCELISRRASEVQLGAAWSPRGTLSHR